MESAQINARSVLEIISRRRWALLLPFLFFIMLAGWLSVALPRAYRGEATLLYQPRAVPKEYVQQLGSFSPEDWLRSLTQRITCRERMVALASELGLYPTRTEGERADLLRQAISVELLEPDLRKDNPYRASREAAAVTAFKLSFEASDPVLASKATNRLAQLLVTENRRARTTQAQAAGTFIREEMDSASTRLAAAQRKVEEFKQRFAGELPEQLQTNTAALATAQVQLQTTAHEKSEVQQKVLQCRQRITEMVHGIPSGSGTAQENPLLVALQEKRQELDMLRSKYTLRHPDVVRAKSELARLESKFQGGTKGTGDAVAQVRNNPLLNDLAAELDAAEAEYRRLDSEEAGLRQEVALVQRRIDMAPQRAQELESLTRDYTAMQASYQALQSKQLETTMAGRLNNQQAGDQFSVLDTAVVPQTPFKPSFKKIFIFCTLMGLVFGTVGAVMSEFADDSFRNENDAEAYLKLPVLASVPTIQTSVELQAARRHRARTIFMAVTIILGYALTLFILHMNNVHLKLPI